MRGGEGVEKEGRGGLSHNGIELGDLGGESVNYHERRDWRSAKQQVEWNGNEGNLASLYPIDHQSYRFSNVLHQPYLFSGEYPRSTETRDGNMYPTQYAHASHHKIHKCVIS